MRYTRREVGKLALAALPGARLIGASDLLAQAARPDSRWAGVQVGINVPYSYGDSKLTMTGAEILHQTAGLGLSAVELRSQPVEMFLGASHELIASAAPPPATASAERKAAQQAAFDRLNAWRRTVSMDRVQAFRTMYEDAGVTIPIVKFDNIYALPDDILDYSFTLARALGGRAISCELQLEDSRRLGRFADKHQMLVGYHGHTKVTPAIWETAFSYAKYNGANVDLGHFVAGNNTSPVPFILEHHDRITHVHVKDRKLHDGPNMPFGQGDTPIREVLQLIRDRRWNIQATIEFEYPVPAGSTRMKEIARCVAYCRDALV